MTSLIRGLADGDRNAPGRLFEVVYDELRGIASAQLGRERAGHTLQPTALVHEAFMKLVDEPALGSLGRREFFGAAATAMRRILIDHARATNRLKRGGGKQKRSLLEDPAADETLEPDDLIALDEALTELALHDERKAKLVELRFFGGLPVAQVCEVLDISRATADREWRTSRAWLAARLSAEEGSGNG
ncbi:MAG: extracytoplasmic sigma factor ECF [Phycisphaeraceae bacterium]|nr:MAG: extracytoplasmic sigma factor ECF [Phycisphaeraceae bacterium]